jgi:large subunit ribosomal protein L18
MKSNLVKHARLSRRVKRVRKKIFGTAERPRLAVSRSLKNVYAQLIDDIAGRTLCAASSQGKDVRALGYGGNARAAKVVGKLLGEKARALGIEQACFDRRGRKYHGRIRALAEAAREAGLKF